MSSFSREITPHGQFIIGVKIFTPTENQTNYEETEKSAVTYRALVDTGANCCSISKKIVTDLNLHPYSHRTITTAGGTHNAPVYLVGLSVAVQQTVMHPEKQSDESVIMKPLVIGEISKGYPRIKVTTFPDVEIDRGFDIILGMDILMHFHITMHSGNIIISI